MQLWTHLDPKPGILEKMWKEMSSLFLEQNPVLSCFYLMGGFVTWDAVITRIQGPYRSEEEVQTYQVLMHKISVILFYKFSCKSFNFLRPSSNYMNHLLWHLVMLHFVFMGFVWFSVQTAIISLNSINQLIFVMVNCGVLFEVQTEF
jgi:hypothetical protein